MQLSPDAILVFIYAGNDFMAPNAGFSIWPSLVDESPGSSILGTVMPRTNWLLINRLRLAQFFTARSPTPPNEEGLIYEALRAPASEQQARLVAHMKKYHYPNLPDARIAEILSRGDGRYWKITENSGPEQEFCWAGWSTSLNWETSISTFPRPQGRARLAGGGQVSNAVVDRGVTAWRASITCRSRSLRRSRYRSEYAEFWKPWPRAFSWNNLCDEWHSQLATAGGTKIRFADLRDDLKDVRAYRKLDGRGPEGKPLS